MQKCKSHLCKKSFIIFLLNPGWILNKWCPICVCSAKSEWICLRYCCTCYVLVKMWQKPVYARTV